ncbi:MAG: hypothetical protein AAF788_05305, partial [Pseudomonadota bacterium]
MERYSISDLIQIGLRRFFWVAIPFLIVLILGLLALDRVPARYHSKALLIVESQQISPDLVPSAVRAYADDRLQTIRAELRARDNVVALAEQFSLINSRDETPFSQKVGAVREDIKIRIFGITNRGGRRQQTGAITFEIGFVHENPQTAFRVANQLVTDFLAA